MSKSQSKKNMILLIIGYILILVLLMIFSIINIPLDLITIPILLSVSIFLYTCEKDISDKRIKRNLTLLIIFSISLFLTFILQIFVFGNTLIPIIIYIILLILFCLIYLIRLRQTKKESLT